jgi:hypothetical protein
MKPDGIGAPAPCAEGLRTTQLECLWHVAETAPELAHLLAEFPRPDRRSTIEVPVPPTTLPFVMGPFFRPPGSHRAFYHCPALVAESGETATAEANLAVTSIKGMESLIWTEDCIGQLFQPCYSAHNIAEHLIISEGKVPGALTIGEAIWPAMADSPRYPCHFVCSAIEIQT